MKRTKAQKRATAKMIAANKRRSKSKRRRGKNPIVAQARRRRRNPIARAGTKAGARKAAKTRAAKKAKRSRAAKKGHRARKHGKKKASGGGKSAKRSRAAKKAARTRRANKAARSAAAKKAARSRKHGKRSGKKAKRSKARKSGKRSKASYRKAGLKAARTRARRRRVPKHMKADLPASQMAYESRRRRKRRSNPIAKARKRRRNPIARASKGFYGIKNPIPLEGGLDFFSGLFAVTIGYLFASGADRMGSTHALTASSSQGGFTDAPAAGEIYNSEATMLPIWSSGKRIAFNALAIAAPLGLSAFIKSRGPKSFFQLMAFAAIARTLGKAADDGLSMALKSTSFGLRVYAPELAAVSKASGAGTAALPAAAPGVFAGAPRQTAQLADPASRPMSQSHQQVAALPQPTFQPHTPAVHQAPLANDRPYVSAPSFNPWADTSH